MSRLLARVMTSVVLLAAVADAGEISFLEDFSLAQDRSIPLKTLIPGTEDYFYFHCLHLQSEENYEQVDALMAKWLQKTKTRTVGYREIENRQVLLQYARAPQKALEFLRPRLGVVLNHQRANPAAQARLPVLLNPVLITRAALTRRALGRSGSLQGFETAALERLVGTKLDVARRRQLISRLTRPDVAGLSRLIVDDLNSAGSRGFGSLPLHRRLLLPQLEKCLEFRPQLFNEGNFVSIYLSKLRPGDDSDWRNDPAVETAYLDRLWNYVGRLDPVHNSLKAHVLSRRLRLDRTRGVYDRQRFLEYLKLPRQAAYVRPEVIRKLANRRFLVNLQANYTTVTALPIVGNDEPLVRACLQHFFLREENFEPYRPYLADRYLKQVFAETKILAGQGDPARWAAWLTPEQYQRLQKRVDLEFAVTNGRLLAPADLVTLELDIKNVKTLIVKVFEINALNYYRDQGREVNTDINLDGLVPNLERTLTYEEPPQRRVRRQFKFPELKGRGTWVVDFIGNGKSSRALVRKGKLRHLVRTGTAGHVFTVLDEAGRKIDGTSIWLAGHEYTATKNGTIHVPFSTAPAVQPIILVHDGFASFERFRHQSENYSFAAGIVVDRESLLDRRKARVVIRPSLSVNGTPVSLGVLKDPRLRITSVNHDGVTTSKDVGEFKLTDDAESVYQFQVPSRLSRIDFVLTARVQNLSLGKPQVLSTGQSFVINAIDQSPRVEDLHLARLPGGYVLEYRGKTGEPRPSRAVRVTLKHGEFREPVRVVLQTDANGRVTLGPLAGIATLAATAADGTSHTWRLGRDNFTYPASIHGLAGEPVRIPWMAADRELDPRNLSLLEVRSGQWVADRFASATLRDGFLQLAGLPAGDYDLLIKPSATAIRIRITAGSRQGGYLLGTNRRLEDRAGRPLQIVSTSLEQGSLSIQLANATAKTRVHVFATRYVPAFSADGFLGRVQDAEPFVVTVPGHPSLFVAGRNIGDEFRYIIERKFEKRFPGNMLQRPSLLLNPWPIRKTTTGRQEAAAGESFRAAKDEKQGAGARGAKKSAPPQPPTDYANLDFLANASLVELNLRVNKQGVVEIARDALAAFNHVHVVAVDARHTASRSVMLPDAEAKFLDLRLARGLDPANHYTQQRQVSVLPKGTRLVIPDVTSSRFEIYDSLARVYDLYSTLSKNAVLAEFRFVLDWPTLDAAGKQAKYSKYACHELNFFLSRKDPEFFRTVVQPFLRNKKDKTFLDHWLLGDDLDRFVDPWSHARLNIVERILLAERLDGELPRTRRHVADLLALLPRNRDLTERLYETALRGRALDSNGKANLGAPVSNFFASGRRARKAGESLDNMAGGVGGALGGGADGRSVARAPAPSTAASAKPQGKSNAKKSKEAKMSLQKETEALDKSSNASRDRNFQEDAALRKRVRQLFRRLDRTQEWVENNYYRLPIEKQVGNLVTTSRFWNDYVHRNPADPFFSKNFADAARSFPEMMFALAVLDLPFRAGEHKIDFKGNALTLVPASPAIVLHREVKPAGEIVGETPVLVTQNFYRFDDRFRQVDGERVDKFVTDEFLVHTVYGCQVVLTNPGSAKQRLDVLLQVPVGAIPVNRARYTRSVHVDLDPYHTQRIEYHFYFPAAGNYRHYPVHVARNERVIAAAEPVVLKAVTEPSRLDLASWAHVSQNGTRGEVLEYLRKHNVLRLDLTRIAFRMKDKVFFDELLGLLRQRHIYNGTLWAYALLHNDSVVIKEYLRHADSFVSQCGSVLQSPLLVIDPVERRTYQHMDYRPLVNARAHTLGQRRQILNDRFHAQYHRLLKIISYTPNLDDNDLMAVTYYLLLQDRVDEALAFFGRVNAGKLQTRLQYDYFTAYLDLFSDKPQVARQVSEKWLARLKPLPAGGLIPVAAGPGGERVGYPVDHWRRLFGDVVAQLDEAEGRKPAADPENEAAKRQKLAASQPNFDIKVETRRLTIDYQNLAEVTVNYYLMDIELLFSRNPFVKQDASRFAHIRPNHSAGIKLPADQARHGVDLPERFHNRNVLVEVRGSGLVRSQAYYSNSLAVQVIEPYGQVRVTDAGNRKPVTRVYVKVYARQRDGRVRFYKDGYTDLRGRFDYTSLNTNDLENVEKFSLLVLSDGKGAVVKEAAPPKR